MKKLIIAGGTGFLGKAIINYFNSKYDEITILTRGESKTNDSIKYLHWDAKTLSSSWQKEINTSHTLINMTGRSVDCRYNDENKKIIMDSRTDSTRILGKAIALSKNPPKIWLNSSTATIYRHSLDMEMDEKNGEIGSGFSVEVAKAWEKVFFNSETPKTRKVALRTSIVLGKNGGALTPIKKLAKVGLGGKQGKGNQKFSWVHVDDFVKSIDFILQKDDLEGPINIVAPRPTTNEKLMKAVQKQVGIGFGIPIPEWLLKIGAILIQTETELILKSRNVVPKKLLKSGFSFKYPVLDAVLKESI